MDPSPIGDEPSSGEEALIDAARREILGDGAADTRGLELNGDVGQGRSVGSPRPDADVTLTRNGPTVDNIPQRIAHYHIKRVIASGGMGTVYEATQDHPRRTVAVKVMRHGITSPRALRRFEYESQILARLHHVGIAHVYEAGWHEEGGERVPYFAMEYIPSARSMLQYADQKHLSARERLRLFISVCQAVHHGHQRGVIHRDLKPGNILVDAQGEVKIIDFGVARSTDADLHLTMLQTSVGEMVGTLKYMSPEQCEADPHDLDIRSDIYSLGVLLFELLSGRLPYDLYDTPIISAPRVICEEPPTRLSSINRSLRGDIETIVAKALEKDRQRRYQSALTMAEDIQRYLNDEPIIARPPSAVYRLRKLVRRRRTPFAVACLLITLGVVAVAAEARARTQARDRELILTVASNTLLDWDKLPIKPGRMLETCNRVIQQDDQNAAAYAIRSRIHFREKEYGLASKDCTKALAIEPDNVLALRTCAYMAVQEGDSKAACILFTRAFKAYALATDLPRDFHNSALMRRSLGEYKGAIADHGRAVALARDFGPVYKGRGVTRYMSGDIDGGIADLEHAAELPGKRAVQCYLWIWEMRMRRGAPGDLEAAEEALNKAEKAAEGNADWEGLMAVWRGRQQPDEFLASVKGDDRAQACYYLGAKALTEGRREEVVEYFKNAADPVLRGYDEYDLANWHLRQIQAP